MAGGEVLEVFSCVPYASRLPRSSCAARWRAANAARRSIRGNDALAHAKATQAFFYCIGCDVGAAHARGETPANAPAVVIELKKPDPAFAPAAEEDSVADKTCTECGKTFEGATSARYCSDDCRGAARVAARRAAVGRGRHAAARKRATAKRELANELDALVERRSDVDGARELLELAGYSVREIRTPAGVMLFIGGGAP